MVAKATRYREGDVATVSDLNMWQELPHLMLRPSAYIAMPELITYLSLTLASVIERVHF